MEKCPVCNTRKGKRKCVVSDGFVCSLCCGVIRNQETCSVCVYYQKPKRKYNEVPAYSVSEMDGDLELQSYGNAIEGGLCAYDIENDGSVKDSDAIRIIELLIDKYYFDDMQNVSEGPLISGGFFYIDNIIRLDLSDIDRDVLVKILSVIRFVAKRRTGVGREYMNVIHKYVGQRIGAGMQILRQI